MPLIVKDTKIKKLYQQSPTVKTQVKKAYVLNKGLKQLVYNSELVLYDNGRYLNGLNSSWVKTQYNLSGGAWGGNCVVTNNADNIYMALSANGQYVAYQIYSNALDVRGFTKVNIIADIKAGYRFAFGVGTYNAGANLQYYPPCDALVELPTIWTSDPAEQTYSLDISGLSAAQLQNLRFYVNLTSSTNYGNSWVNIKKIWFD